MIGANPTGSWWELQVYRISFSIQMYGLGPPSTNVEVWDIDVEKAQQLEPEGWSRAVVPSIDS